MKKIALLIFTVALITTISSCSSAPSYNIEKGWVKKGVTYEQAKKQLFDCKEKAKSTAERDTQIGGLTESCMTLEGYTWGQYKTEIK